MQSSGQSSKTIALLVAIVAVTVALLGAEAWNRSHRGQKPAAQTAAITAPESAPAAPKRVRQRANGPDHGTPDSHGEIMMNQ